MKKLNSLVIALCLFVVVQGSIAQERTFGLGIILGEPTGISAKLWTSHINAFDFGLGWSNGGVYNNNNINNGSRTHFHMDYLWHSFEVIHSTDRVPIYYGVGGLIYSGAGYDAALAVRGVFGIAWMPRETPIDIFLELVPTLQLTQSTNFGIDAGIGIRYYF